MRLSNDFISNYKEREPRWGFGALSEVVFYRTYSRKKSDGSKEQWWETVRRVTEAIMSVYDGVFNEDDLTRLSENMYDAIYNFKLVPSGRGFWALGTDIVDDRDLVEALSSCAFISTEGMTDATPFEFMMDLSMLGVGLGFDTLGAGNIVIKHPEYYDDSYYKIPDSREGWVNAVKTVINAFFLGNEIVDFDYSDIRPAGAPIKTFGGVCPGPEPLKELIDSLIDYFIPLIGEEINERHITDIFTMIGKAVVSGNVRRCLPKGTIVHTKHGLENIEDVVVGSLVRTQNGYKKVLENVYQGKQDTIVVNTELGEIESTPDHRWKVFTGLDSFEWKEAQNLTEGDRLVFVKDFEVEGKKTHLPQWEYDYPPHSTTCKEITIPELDNNMAWFLGLFHGDGYVYPNFSKDGFNAHVSIACSPDYGSIVEKVKEQLERFEINLNIIDEKDSDRCVKVKAQSKQLAWYLSQFKEANEEIKVPEFISQGTRELRASYIAGLMDANGCYDKSWKITSIYKMYLKEVQVLLASLGIASYVKLKRKTSGNLYDLYELYIKGSYHRKKFYDVVGKYSLKAPKEYEYKKSQYDYSYPDTLVRAIEGFTSCWHGVGDEMTENHYDKFVQKNLVKENNATPIKVIGVSLGSRQDTYDLSIEDNHEFVVNQGLLSHNTALLALLPEGFEDLKDYEKYPERESYGWLANHSIVGESITDYKSIAKNAMVNGEPAVVWLERAQKYGRFVDGESKTPDKANGVNACAEMNLESYEHCLLVEVALPNIKNLNEFVSVSKLAHLYGKAITVYLARSRWEKSSEVISRNRRIGISLGGVAQFLGYADIETLVSWCDIGYNSVREQDKTISNLLGISESIKLTTVKPSGTTSILAGTSPGAHLVISNNMIKRMRIANGLESLNKSLKSAGVEHEPAFYENDATVYTFPYNFENGTLSYDNVKDPMHTQINIAEILSHWWADNAISLTVIIPKETKQEDIEEIIKTVKLKTISFLPEYTDKYEQMPLEKVEFSNYKKINVDLHYGVNGHADAELEKFCKDDVCELKEWKLGGENG